MASGLCMGHHKRLVQGKDLRAAMRQPNGSSWVLPNGYVRCSSPGHPNAQPSGQIMEHRLVMSQTLGRALLPGETVHHRNGDRQDNRPENLELKASNHGVGGSVDDLCAWAEEVLRRYRPAMLAGD